MDRRRLDSRRPATINLTLWLTIKTPLLDRTFAALADPTRRALLARLDEEEGLTVSELARPFPVSLPAIMKHLDVLSDAGLIERTKSGRTVTCQLKAAPMEQAMNWLARYERYWTEQLDRLAAFLEEEFMASKPSLALKRRFKAPPAQLFEAWTQPEKMIRWWGVTGHPKRAHRRDRPEGRRPLPRAVPDAGRRASQRERRLSRGRARPQAGLLVGLAEHARARIAGHRSTSSRTVTAPS